MTKKTLKEKLKGKELVEVDNPFVGYCDNPDHPLFTVKVSVDRPYGVCYYCSKVYKLKDS
jgi:hypothetical protein